MKLISVFASFGMLFTLTACGQTDSDGDSYDWNDFEPDNEDIAYRDVSPDVNTFGFTMRIISQCDVKINKVDSDSIAYTDGNTSDYCVWNQGQRKWIHKTGDYNTDYHYSDSELGQTYYVNINKAYKNSDGEWEDTSIGFKDENTMKAWLQWAKKNNVHYDWSSNQNYP